MKKFIASVLAAVMTAAALPAFAETALPEQAIAVAKTTFSIPAELTEFGYNVDEDGYELGWHDKEYEKSVRVQLNADLIPISYNVNTHDEPRGLSYLHRSQLQKTAEEFIRNTIPALSDRLIPAESDGGSNSFTFNRYENGARVENNRATVYVSKSTGEVISYSLNWDFESDFGGESKLTQEQAYEKLNEAAVSTEYRIFDKTAIPVYALDRNTYVSAEDGTPFSAEYYYYGAKNSAVTMDAAVEEDVSGGSGFGAYRLTEEEIREVEKMNSLISSDKVKEIIASLPELMLPEKYEMNLRYTSLKNKDSAKYRINCGLEGAEDSGYAELTLDGENGEILGFYSYNDELYRKVENPVSDEVCAAAADSFFAKTKELSDYRLNENNSISGERYISKSYVRYINDIPYPSDYKTVRVSKADGRIYSYGENIPDAEIVIPDSMADKLTAVKNNCTVELVYAYKAEESSEMKNSYGSYYGSKPVLAYKLNPNYSFYCLRAEDGVAVNYGNEPVVPDVEKTDEKDHWAWNVFDILRENGIYVKGSYSFDDEITKSEFAELIRGLYRIDAVPYRYYNFDEEDETAQLPISREEAVRLVAVQMGWEQLIDLDIYTTKFADEADFSGGIGAAAILQGMKIMNGDGNGNFMPKRNLTYGDAYSVAFNLAQLGVKNDDGVEPIVAE
ncbi:MAG: YcdB/YcdC domain-containing protein [Clostridia bacterium]